MTSLAVIGAGAAGLVCAASAAQHGFAVTIFERTAPGGQLNLLGEVAVFPGGPEVSGPDLAGDLTDYAMNTGVGFRYEEITGIERAGAGWQVGGEVFDQVVMATGSHLDLTVLPGAEPLIGRGVSLCAACDGPLYKGKRVAVAGGGRDAVYEAVELTRHAAEVVLLRTPGVPPPALAAHADIRVVDVERFTACTGDPIESVSYVDTKGDAGLLEIDGLFPAVARTVPTLDMPDGDFTVVGDARQGSARTILSAMGDGSRAAALLSQVSNNGAIPR
ncbi:MAG TPA: FAD-dependent oxidoreductase [Amycolatopsis sp.]|nr:FAD-dependent oxidoreductase [Amycolatopsis sp.]